MSTGVVYIGQDIYVDAGSDVMYTEAWEVQIHGNPGPNDEATTWTEFLAKSYWDTEQCIQEAYEDTMGHKIVRITPIHIQVGYADER